MGWMTLHSISVAYPDEPTEAERKLLDEFMNAFSSTITCIHCRQHFGSMFTSYKRSIPTWADSKRDLFLAICRMHNTVNKKLDKPTPKTVGECISTLKNATSYTSQSDFRQRYIEYLFKDWNKYGKGTSYQLVAFNSINIMQKINNDYWSLKEVPYSGLNIAEADVLTYSNQPVIKKIVFPKFNLRNVKLTPR